MTYPRRFVTALLFLGALAPLPWLSESAPQASGATSGALLTLSAADDLLSSYDLDRGVPGGRIDSGRVDLTAADLAFGLFAVDQLSAGFVYDEVATLVDLGPTMVPSRALAKDPAPGFPISAFHTLRVERGAFFYDDGTGRRVRAKEARAALAPVPDAGPVHAQPAVGHVYVLRLRNRTGDRNDRLFKLKVVDHEPERFVTLRWARVPVQ